MQHEEALERLNHPNRNSRLEALQELMQCVRRGDIALPVKGMDVNNHIHSTYSFSPYSPTKAIWKALEAGLCTAGIMDHDSIGGSEEFIQAGQIAGMATTIGVECRVRFSGTPVFGRKINNPDQSSVAYMALHGIPHTQIARVKTFFQPYQEHRNRRNMAMLQRINDIVSPHGLALDFEDDVLPLSMALEGGSVTERHLLYALALKMIESLGRGKPLLDFLRDSLHLPLGSKVTEYLSDVNNPHYAYDLLGLLKSDMVEKFYLDAQDECPHVKDILAFAWEIGAITAYAYLGDVGESVTGDKRAQKFEDDYLDELFAVLKDLGFLAVTYMPSRNTAAQMDRVRSLCDTLGFFQISGEDVNSSRQSMVCIAQRDPKFSNLYNAAWALIGHELAATENLDRGMFSPQTMKELPSLAQRIPVYQKIGMEMSPSEGR